KDHTPAPNPHPPALLARRESHQAERDSTDPRIAEPPLDQPPAVPSADAVKWRMAAAEEVREDQRQEKMWRHRLSAEILVAERGALSQQLQFARRKQLSHTHQTATQRQRDDRGRETPGLSPLASQ